MDKDYKMKKETIQKIKEIAEENDLDWRSLVPAFPPKAKGFSDEEYIYFARKVADLPHNKDK